MKEFLKILYRFVPRYKKYLVLNVSFNLLAAFLTLFSFALIIPILEMLFKIGACGARRDACGDDSPEDG